MEMIQKTPTEMIKDTLLQQNEQGQVLLQIVERMEEQEKRVDNKINDVEELVEAVNKRVHLDEGEASDIQSLVAKKAWYFAIAYFGDDERSENMFMSKVGQFRGNIYRRLKKAFNVNKYTNIKHTDFENAYNFIESIRYEDFSKTEIRPTQKQLELMELEK